MNEEEIKKLVQGELDKFAKNYYRRNYPGFNMTSGHNTEAHGVGEYMYEYRHCSGNTFL